MTLLTIPAYLMADPASVASFLSNRYLNNQKSYLTEYLGSHSLLCYCLLARVVLLQLTGLIPLHGKAPR